LVESVDLNLGPLSFPRGACWNLNLVDLAPQVVQVRILQDVVDICPILGLILWMLLAPCHSLIKITMEPLDIMMAVITEKQSASNVNRAHLLDDGTFGIDDVSLITVTRPRSRLLAETAPLVLSLFEGLAIGSRRRILEGCTSLSKILKSG
jgi:hypothetical protein